MVKTITAIAMASLTTVAAQASYLCSVHAENPEERGTYNLPVASKEVDLNSGRGGIVHFGGNYVVSVSKNDDFLQVATSTVKKPNKIIALATAKTNSIFLLDARNQIMISCQEK